MKVRLPEALAIVVGLAAVSACGSSDSTNTTAPSPPTATIAIVGQNGTQAFTPNPAAFGGQQVVFRNNDGVIHRIVFNDGGADTGDITPGATSRSVTMPAGGTNYHCTIHPGMIGSTNAVSGAPAPPCTGPYCDPY